MDEKLPNRRHEQRAQYPEVPLFGRDPIEIVVRVSLAGVQTGKQALLDVSDIQLLFPDEAEVYPVDGFVPVQRTLSRRVATAEKRLMGLEVGAQAWVLG